MQFTINVMNSLINPRLRELANFIGRALSKDERRSFDDFTKSPYHNKSETAGSFCRYLADSAQSGSLDSITEKDLRKRLFGGAAVNERKFRSLCSNSRRLFEDFLIQIEFGKNEHQRKILLLESLSSAGLTKNFSSLIGQISKESRKNYYRDANYFTQAIRMQRTVIENLGIDIEADLTKEYRKLSDLADRQFFLCKLELVNSLLSRKYHVLGDAEFQMNMLREIRENIEENKDYLRRSEIALYSEYLILQMMMSEDNEKYFHELYEYVSQNFRKYSHAGLELVYYPLVNYGSNRAALGDGVFLNYVFRIYLLFERNGFYANLRSVQDLDYISIKIISLKVGKIAWAERFLKKYISKLNKASQKDNESLAKGLISFSRRSYADAVRQIGKVNYLNSYYYLKSKETLIKIYYETGDMVALMPLLDSTRHYVKRRKAILSIHHDRYMEFLKCMTLLVKIRQKENGDTFKLRSELKRNKNMISSDWLAEKLYELEGR